MLRVTNFLYSCRILLVNNHFLMFLFKQIYCVTEFYATDGHTSNNMNKIESHYLSMEMALFDCNVEFVNFKWV